ncbi:MAG TPA: serine/threonine-protein kinase [Polyangiaceae bacterium]
MSGQPGNFLESSAPLDNPPQPGDVLAGKYRVESILGAGGMGVVVLVQHIELGQRMAIKLMTPGVNHDPQAAIRFLREARAAAGLQSEHVVRIFDVGTLDSGAPYMVMELLRGEDLSQLLSNVGRLAVSEAVDYVLQACHAIAEAHAMGIVHRDLKPSNLFLTRRSDGSPLVKVLDFGISKAMSPEGDSQFSANLTTTSAVMGSPLYMSPEQVRNAKQVDARADIWSLGVILHELLTGSPAFHADTLPGICAAIIADNPPPLRSLREDAPSELEDVLNRCLEKSVKNRYQTTREFMTALRPFASSGYQPSPTVATQTLRGAGGSNRAAPSADPSAPVVSRPADPTLAAAGPPPTPNAQSSLGTSAVAVATSQKSFAGSTGRRPIALIVGAVLVLAAAAAIAFVATRRETAGTGTSAEPREAPQARKTFALVIDSTPRGAEVLEADKFLGTTPLQISVDNEAARLEARKLIVRRDGYQAYSIVQGPSEDNVRIIASLVANAEPPAAAAAKSHPPTAPVAPSPKAVKSTPLAEPTTHASPAASSPPPPHAPPTPSAPDIRLQR